LKTYLVSFDTETTNADPKTAGIVQLAYIVDEVDLEDNSFKRVNEVNVLCKPDCPLTEEASKIHGITEDMLVNCCTQFEAVQNFVKLLTDLSFVDTVILCGQNSLAFDLKILERVYPSFDWNQFYHIDTYLAAIRLYPDAPNHQLSTLAVLLNLRTKQEVEEGAHDALFDIEMVRELILPMMQSYSNKDYDLLQEDRVEFTGDFEDDLIAFSQWLLTPAVHRKIHFGKHKGKLYGRGKFEDRAKYVPKFYIEFIVDKFDSPLPDLVATIQHHYNLRFKNA
jgi:DNA polymerase III alpha subunit (gram-positive type)